MKNRCLRAQLGSLVVGLWVIVRAIQGCPSPAAHHEVDPVAEEALVQVVVSANDQGDVVFLQDRQEGLTKSDLWRMVAERVQGLVQCDDLHRRL